MARKQNSPVECIQDEECLILRYTSSFRLRAIVILLLGLAAGIGLLVAPITAILRGRFLEIITWGTFLLIIGGIVTCFAVSGWLHMACYGWREVVLNRRTGTCSIPTALFRHRRIELRDIKGVRIIRDRLEAGTYRNIDSAELWATHHRDKDSLWLVLAKPQKPQRLWGRLGISQNAERVGQTIATFLDQELERQPPRHFDRKNLESRR